MIQILIGVVAVGLLVGGAYVVQNHTEEPEGSTPVSVVSDNEMNTAPVESVVMNDELQEGKMMKDEAMDGVEVASDVADDTIANKDVDGMAGASASSTAAAPAQYLPYTPMAVATYGEVGDVVLFFRASWCPSCRALDADITAKLRNAPVGLTILDVDYDTATDLRRQYGVTTQHTLVQVAADGALIKKWSGGSTLASVMAEVE